MTIKTSKKYKSSAKKRALIGITIKKLNCQYQIHDLKNRFGALLLWFTFNDHLILLSQQNKFIHSDKYASETIIRSHSISKCILKLQIFYLLCENMKLGAKSEIKSNQTKLKWIVKKLVNKKHETHY